MPSKQNPITVAVDTGGTFTDCVWLDERGRLQVLKVPSSPADPSLAIGAAIEQIALGQNVVLLHGTTVGTNAVLERRGETGYRCRSLQCIRHLYCRQLIR